MDYSCADREPVQLDRWNDTSNKISAEDQTIRKAVQREKSDSDTEDAVRFRPDERPLKQQPGDACPDDEPEKRDRNRNWRVAEERLVHEARGSSAGGPPTIDMLPVMLNGWTPHRYVQFPV